MNDLGMGGISEGKVWLSLMDGNTGVTPLPTDSSKVEMAKQAVSP